MRRAEAIKFGFDMQQANTFSFDASLYNMSIDDILNNKFGKNNRFEGQENELIIFTAVELAEFRKEIYEKIAANTSLKFEM